jgi:hypothetical protein
LLTVPAPPNRRTFLSDVELGRKEPCLRSLEAFADALGVSLGQRMGGL